MFGKTPRGATQRPAPSQKPAKLIPAWLWLIFGVLFGLFLAVLLYLWQPWQPAQRDTPQTSAEQTTTPAATPDQQGEYAFYDLLPKQQVTPVPEQEVPITPKKDEQPQPLPDTGAITAPVAQIQDAEHADPAEIQNERKPVYILQVNSFDNADDADHLRAEVLLVGLSADVRQTTTADGATWYRVVSGPYVSRGDALNAQQTLQNSGIDALVVEQP